MDMPTTHPGRLRPPEVNSSDDARLLKNEQPSNTIPPVKRKKTIRSIRCILLGSLVGLLIGVQELQEFRQMLCLHNSRTIVCNSYTPEKLLLILFKAQSSSCVPSALPARLWLSHRSEHRVKPKSGGRGSSLVYGTVRATSHSRADGVVAGRGSTTG